MHLTGSQFWFIDRREDGPTTIDSERILLTPNGLNVYFEHAATSPGDYRILELVVDRKTVGEPLLPTVVRFGFGDSMFARQHRSETGVFRFCFGERVTESTTETLARIRPYGNAKRDNEFEVIGARLIIDRR